MIKKDTIVSQQDRNLKWRALDVLERILMILCGVSIAGFTLCVFLDVITRSIGHPWLWLQEVTLAFFVYGLFLGTAVAFRRNEHMILANPAELFTGKTRLVLETFTRLITLAIAGIIIYQGYFNFLHDFGSYLMPSMTPLAVLTGILPITGSLIALFTVEQLFNGWKKGFDSKKKSIENGNGPDSEELIG